MTPILDRIRANGGEVIRDRWMISLRAGRLNPAALDWLRVRKSELMQEIWPGFDDWIERAAIMEFDAGMLRADAEAAAYRGVS